MDSDRALLKIGRETSIIFAGFFLGTLFQYLYKMLLARSLGPKLFGVFAQGLGIIQTASVLSLVGLHLSIPRFISFYTGKDDKNSLGNTVSAGLIIILVTSTIVSILLFLFAETIALQFFEEPSLVDPLKFFSFTVIPLSTLKLIMSLFRGQQDALTKVIVDDFIWSGALVVFVLISVLLSLNVSGAVYAYFAGTSVACLIGGLIYLRKSNHGLPKNDLPFKRLVAFTWPLFLIAVFAVTNRWFDVLMLGWLSSSAKAGIYDISFSIAGYVALVLNSVGFMFMPVISELYGRGEKEKIKTIFTTSTRWLITLSLPLLVGMLIFPEEIILILFGSQYLSGKLSLIIISIGFFFKVLRGPSNLVLVAAGKTRDLMIGTGVISTLIITLNLLLIPEYGMIGAAISTLTAYMIGDSLILLYAAREVGCYPYNKGFIRIVPPIIMSSLTAFGIKKIFDLSLAFSILTGILMVIIYPVLLYAFDGIRREDYRLLKKAYKQKN